MRTTLDIDDELLAAAREIARRERQSLGQVISRLAREALAGTHRADDPAPRGAGGFRPFPSRGTPVTNEAIDQLRDEAGS
ncbi:MAG: hypothetical protein R3202_06105 [Candidatus Competibacterales bacterium]|nr:hypothetical protein [Candidatus Competibacterales bacterium]